MDRQDRMDINKRRKIVCYNFLLSLFCRPLEWVQLLRWFSVIGSLEISSQSTSVGELASLSVVTGQGEFQVRLKKGNCSRKNCLFNAMTELP